MNYIDIITRLKERDTKALEEIILEFNQYVAAIVYTILQGYIDEIDIQGIINQVFFILWEKAEKIDIKDYNDLKPYLGAIARNTAINEKKKITPTVPLDEHILGEINENFSQVELRAILLSALKQLSTENQIILLKFYFQEKTIKQIAEEEKQPESTVKTKLKRSKAKLKRILEKEGFIYEN
ncbi:RNA polymerase sigma factor [Faecalicatena orotica]|uniref:RNA polymerase sigma factor n=1 Tax=Faecalicatena orotica TaxID=1544 RepID=UPI003216BE92